MTAMVANPLSIAGFAISLVGLGISLAALRYARMKHFASYPYVTATRNNQQGKLAVYWNLTGPGKEDWEVTRIASVRGGALLQVEWITDNWGQSSPAPVQPPKKIRSVEGPSNPVLTTDPGEPITLDFWTRSKSNPSMKLKRRVTVRPLAT